jgi:hypothetical protein
MSGKGKKGPLSDTDRAFEKLDKVTELLENLFILQALSLGVGRDNICDALRVHTTRVSEINKGLKRAKNGKNDA